MVGPMLRAERVSVGDARMDGGMDRAGSSGVVGGSWAGTWVGIPGREQLSGGRSQCERTPSRQSVQVFSPLPRLCLGVSGVLSLAAWGPPLGPLLYETLESQLQGKVYPYPRGRHCLSAGHTSIAPGECGWRAGRKGERSRRGFGLKEGSVP